MDSIDADELDQPPYDGETTNYVICSTPRTGSSLLCELLLRAGVGVPMEYFHRRNHVPKLLSKYGLLDDKTSIVKMEDYIAALKRNRATPNGYFGFKAHRGQYKWLVDNCDLERCFPGLKYIYIWRDDTLAQAVSVSKAVQTKQWISSERSAGKPEYNEHHINYCLHTIQKSNRYWRELFRQKDIAALNIAYEDLTRDKGGVLEKTLAYLGATNVSIPPEKVATTLERQSDAINQEWINRYRSRHDIEADGL